MDIEIKTLRSLCEQLLSLCEEKGYAIINLPVDYYWDVPTQSRYDPYQRPEDLTLGQLSDDWSELRKIIENGDSKAISYTLVWLAAVIRAIGENTVW